ncbi:TyeA family type III secretion system gatekeeper subunit [Parashewanella tropica]|uniref:TyeA family type III secretion system gatekeeper subunit n=1 Tax=Parashewanella tropica TaxID=2547970 RepID=UPI001059E88C|nr:TyeA family type III secretion system gatekeeper subunit [Parashewanella tropica]
MRIDGANTVNLNTQTENQSVNGQVHPAHNTAALAAAEFAEVQAESMQEAMDDIGLGASNFLKKLSSKNQKDETRLNTLEELVANLEGEQAEGMATLASELAALNDGDAILAKVGQMKMDAGNVMLLLATVISSGEMSNQVKEKLRKKLQELLSEEGAELALIAAMEGLPLDQAGLESLKSLYQRAEHGEAGLAKWFSHLKDMPDRRKRIRVLLRALSNSLNEDNTGTDMVKIVTVIDDLRRLLIFMSIEEHCNVLARAFEVKSADVLSISLELIEQSWVYAEWLEGKIKPLILDEERQISFLRRWRDLLLQIPNTCFRDPEQQSHVADAMMDLLDKWCDEE